MENTLWYDRPAANWNEALPLGNGFMGAMCFGGTLIDRFQLNLDSLWHGYYRDRINPDARKSVDRVRDLLREGRIREALCTVRGSLPDPGGEGAGDSPGSEGVLEPTAVSERGASRIPAESGYPIGDPSGLL